MEENLKEKEFYRGGILGMLENVDKIEILAYIYTVVSDIIEEERQVFLMKEIDKLSVEITTENDLERLEKIKKLLTEILQLKEEIFG